VTDESRGETFEDFKGSFYYGTRSDLHFKFLSRMSDEDAAGFFRVLLETLGDVFDTGDYDRVRRLIYEWQVRAYDGDGQARFHYDDGPFVPFDTPLEDATVALVGAGGVYVEGDDPTGGETQEEAEARIGDYLREAPTLVTIPHDVPTSELRVRHPGYDVRGARRDINAIFPVDILRELVAEGAVGGENDHHYGFVGATSQLHLRKEVAPDWAERLRREEVDLCLLVPT
jgi:hypothetical protein